MSDALVTKVELFDVRTRGMIARMFDLRNTEPTEGAWSLIRGEREITVSDIAEIAYTLGFHVDLLSAEGA